MQTGKRQVDSNFSESDLWIVTTDTTLIVDIVTQWLSITGQLSACIHYPTGCFFLFSQCIFRQVQANGLLTDYADSVFSLFIRCLAALSFVSVDDVIINFDILIDAGYRAERVVNYFEDI